MKIKFILASLAVVAVSVVSANAQSEDFEPHWFVGAKGGIQAVPTNYDFGKLITPAFGVNGGYQFAPQFGVRLDLQGISSKTAFVSADATEKFNWFTSNVDMLFNVTRMISNKSHLVDFSVVAGLGYDFSWNAGEAAKYPYVDRYCKSHETANSFNVRAGGLVDFNINKNWGVQAEVDGNLLYDEFNSKNNTKEDWQLTAMVGVVYRFGHKGSGNNKPARTAPAEEVLAPGQLPATVYKNAEDIRIEIFFEKGKAGIRPAEDAKLRGLSNYMRSHNVGEVIVSAYADKGTGTPAGNMKITEERAKAISEELTKTYGIPADRISAKAYGDTVQPYAENDKNRVVIIEVKEAK